MKLVSLLLLNLFPDNKVEFKYRLKIYAMHIKYMNLEPIFNKTPVYLKHLSTGHSFFKPDL